MSGPKRNADSLNTIGIVVVGICGAVLVYVSIVALQAFYMNDTSEIQTMADYGGNDSQARSLRTAQVQNITEVGKNAEAQPKPGEQAKGATYRLNIDDAMRLVVEGAKVDPSNLVPSQGRSDKATIKPIPGRPVSVTPDPATTAPAAPTGGTGAGSAAGSASVPEPSVPMAPTGGQAQGGSAPTGGNPGTGTAGTPPPTINLPNTTGTGSATPVGAGSGSAVPTPASSVNQAPKTPNPAPKGNAP
ncbi:MAG: hypothetical protein H0T46_11640 [Deltaproteobacteria bacterium]|nr:hypothetical protein [Deltaproteobacteria bacterium]